MVSTVRLHAQLLKLFYGCINFWKDVIRAITSNDYFKLTINVIKSR